MVNNTIIRVTPQFYIKILALLIVFEILYNHIYTKVLPTLYRKSFTWGQSLSLFVALFCSFCYVFILFVSSQFITICGFTFFLEIKYSHHVLYCFRMKVLLLGKKGRMAVFKKKHNEGMKFSISKHEILNFNVFCKSRHWLFKVKS